MCMTWLTSLTEERFPLCTKLTRTSEAPVKQLEYVGRSDGGLVKKNVCEGS